MLTFCFMKGKIPKISHTNKNKRFKKTLWLRKNKHSMKQQALLSLKI